MSEKNEHIVYAYGEKNDAPGEHVLLVGVTEIGLATLRERRTLTIAFPHPIPITDVIVYHEKDKSTLKAVLRESGVPVSEFH
jgi:hypothetical protein